MSSPCPLCGEPTERLHANLKDELYGSIGIWHMYRCSGDNCRLGSLQPPPTSAEILAAYESYHTHGVERDEESPAADINQGTGNIAKATAQRVWRTARQDYHARRWGYPAPDGSVLQKLTAGVLSRLITLLPGHRADFDAATFYLRAATTANPQLLEVGCGSGKLLSRLQASGWNVTGTDFDDQAVTTARAQGLNVLLGPLGAQNFEPASFDAIVLKHVLEHVPEPVAELALCRSLLKPGGRLVVLTPNLAGRGHERWQRNWRGLEPPRHLHLFTPAALRTALSANDLSIEQLTTTGRTRTSYRESLDAERLTEGKGTMPTLPSLVLAELDEWLEALMRLRDPLCGNELLAIARAPATAQS